MSLGRGGLASLSKEEKLERPVTDLKDIWTGSKQAWGVFLNLSDKYRLEKISDVVTLTDRKLKVMKGFGKGTRDRLEETLNRILLSTDMISSDKLDYSR